jgi:PHD/YefM family antitoxin component YafN of YafNO toxin-antitoxin module
MSLRRILTEPGVTLAVDNPPESALKSALIPASEYTMNNIPAQEIKRCGISAVDDALRQGPVHIIKNNRPQYVVLTEEHYTDLLEAQASADRDSLQTSLDDLKAGRITRYDDVDALMRQIEQDDAQ